MKELMRKNDYRIIDEEVLQPLWGDTRKFQASTYYYYPRHYRRHIPTPRQRSLLFSSHALMFFSLFVRGNFWCFHLLSRSQDVHEVKKATTEQFVTISRTSNDCTLSMSPEQASQEKPRRVTFLLFLHISHYEPAFSNTIPLDQGHIEEF